jgi:hypothetical protein
MSSVAVSTRIQGNTRRCITRKIQSVSRIVEAARRFRETEDIERVWEWAQNELIKLSMSEGYAPTHDFSEATHAEVIEAVYDRLVADQN